MHGGVPEDEDEEHEKHAEGGHIVHGLHQHHQLPLQSWHETNQLQHAHQPESPEYRQTAALLTHDLPYAVYKEDTGEQANLDFC